MTTCHVRCCKSWMRGRLEDRWLVRLRVATFTPTIPPRLLSYRCSRLRRDCYCLSIVVVALDLRPSHNPFHASRRQRVAVHDRQVVTIRDYILISSRIPTSLRAHANHQRPTICLHIWYNMFFSAILSLYYYYSHYYTVSYDRWKKTKRRIQLLRSETKRDMMAQWTSSRLDLVTVR